MNLTLKLFLFATICSSCLGQEKTNRFTTQVSQYGDEWVVSLFGFVDITEAVGMNVEIDTTGYVSLGASYGYLLKKSYIEAYTNYGRGDFFDLINIGLFGVRMLSEKWLVYSDIGHEWRETNSFPFFGGQGIFDQTELRLSIGAIYSILTWMDLDVSINHDRLLSGKSGITAVENPNLNYQSVSLIFKPKYVEPFVRYTHGAYRVRPGDPIPTHNSFEAGFRFKF